MVQAPGRVIPRCSNDDLVVVEQMYFLFYVPSGLALRVALTDIPSDSTKLYDHVHAGCRTLQYQSAKLAHQLGPDDKDGRLNITLVSAADVYDGAAVAGALIDVAVPLGQDTRPC